MNNDSFNNGFYTEPIDLWGEGTVLFDAEREKRTFSRIGFGLALFSLVSLGVSLMIQIIAMLAFPAFSETSLFLNITTDVSLYLFALPVLMLTIGKLEVKAPEKRKMGLGKWLVILIICFGLMYIGSFVGNYVMALASEIVGYDYNNMLESVIDDNNLWVTAIFTVVIAPIGEEFVFRKLIIDRTAKYGCFISVMLSGLAFGLMHTNFYQFFYAAALGIVLGYVYYNTGKLHLTIALHATINFVGSIVSSWLMQGTEKMEEALANMDGSDPMAGIDFILEHGLTVVGLIVFELFVLGAMICAVLLPILLRKRIVIGKGEVVIPKHRVLDIVVVNAGIIVMLIVYALEFALNMLPVN